MSFWRLRGSPLLGFFVSLLVLWILAAGEVAGARETQKGTDEVQPTVRLQVTLSGITSYNDFQEIRAALSQSEGVEKVSVDTEAPGLVTLNVKYAGEPRSLVDKLIVFFPTKYVIKEKDLPSGVREISISRVN